MSAAHRQRLVVTKQSGTGFSCELTASQYSDSKTSACSGCSGCGHSSGTPDAGSKSIGIEIPRSFLSRRNLTPMKVGQSIDIEAPGEMLLALSLVVYLLPVLLMLFFTVCGGLMFPASEARVALSAVVGFGLGLLAIIFFGPALRFHILKRLTVRSSFDDNRQLKVTRFEG